MRKFTRSLAAIAVIVASSTLQTANAQWSLSGNAGTTTSVLGTTNAFPLKLITNNVTRMTITSAGKIGIGNAAPSNILTVQGSGSVPSSVWTNAGAPLFVGLGETTVGNADYILGIASNIANARPVFIGRRSRGTLAAPTVVLNNDQLSSNLVSGYDGTAFQNPAAVDFFVDGVPSAGNVPGRISFVTGTNGANRLERLKIGSTGDITVNTNQLFVQKATGNVGIGTNTPSVPLDVKSTSAYIGRFNGGNNMYLSLFENDLYRGYLGSYSGNAADVDFGTGAGNAGGSVNLTIQAVPKVTIDSAGSVGIGNTTPASRLDIAGNAAYTTSVVNVLNNYVGTSDVRGIKSYSKASDGWGYGIEATGGFIGGSFLSDAGAYASYGYGVYANAIGTAGTRVGVYGYASGGTINNWGGYFPVKTYTSELRVGGEQGATGYVASINGKLIATEVRVQPTANWPDYVFGKDHILMSLEELETKINADKHLPGIPAATDVKENGLMLGEMQTKQMEKIEELTLYVIELGKQNKELKNEIDLLKTLVNSKK